MTRTDIKPGYKMTKLGWIPEEWEVVILRDILTKSKLGGNYKNSIEKTNSPLIKMGNLGRGSIKLDKLEYITGGEHIEEIDLLSQGDLLFNTRNTLALVGKVAIWNSELPIAYYNSNLMRLEFHSDHIESNYFANYLFNSEKVIGRLFGLATGTTSVAAIYTKDLLKIKLVLPPLPEQKKIAQILSTWDQAIEKTQSLIQKMQDRKKGLMQQLLTGKKRLPGFSGEWEEYTIDSLFSKTNRYVKWDEEEFYPLVSIRRRYGGMFKREPLQGKSIGVKKLKTIQKNDFLISKRQVSHGAWVVVKSDFDGGKVSNEYDCLEIRDETILSPSFWSWFINRKVLTHYAFLDSIGIHIEKLIFHYSMFLKRLVKIPSSIKEQIAIAQVLTQADQEIRQTQNYLAQLQQLKKGLMQQLLTGQKRVVV